MKVLSSSSTISANISIFPHFNYFQEIESFGKKKFKDHFEEMQVAWKMGRTKLLDGWQNHHLGYNHYSKTGWKLMFCCGFEDKMFRGLSGWSFVWFCWKLKFCRGFEDKMFRGLSGWSVVWFCGHEWESLINCKGGNKDKKRKRKDGFMNAGRGTGWGGGGARRVLLLTLGYTIKTNYGNRRDEEAE